MDGKTVHHSNLWQSVLPRIGNAIQGGMIVLAVQRINYRVDKVTICSITVMICHSYLCSYGFHTCYMFFSVV
jgi:hypothetical protein